jgi:hypothetical protein
MKMKAPAGCRQVSHDGRSYRVSEDGTVEVPAAARVGLEEHGFVVVRETAGRAVPRPRRAKE